MKRFFIGLSIILLLLVLLSSCTTIPQDNTPAPLDNNLRTLEMTSCEKREVGLLSCSFNDGNFLGIPVWHKGEYKITSNRCGININGRYEKDQVLYFSYKRLLENRGNEDECLYDVMLFIDGHDRGIRGEFLLVSNEFDFAPFTFGTQSFINGLGYVQIREGANIFESLQFKESSSGTIFWDGCLKSGEKSFNKDPEILFSEIIDGRLSSGASCILTIGLILEDKEPKIAKFNIKIFDRPVLDIPDPVITYKNNKLEVKAPSYVAVMAINDTYKVFKNDREKKISEEVKKNETVFVRLATSNGRYKLYLVNNGEVIWKNFLRY